MRNSSSKNAASRAARFISVPRYSTNKNRMASKSVVAAEQTRFPSKFGRRFSRRSFEFAQVPYYQFRDGVIAAELLCRNSAEKKGFTDSGDRALLSGRVSRRVSRATRRRVSD